jgi:polyisoprenoid-binding protein YceI
MKAIKKTSILSAIVLTFAFANVSAQSVSGSKSIDAEKSTIDWKGEKVTGQHVGTIALKSGSLEMKDNKLTGGSFVIDMSSIENTDLEGEYKGKLEGHLKSDDFFGVTSFPEAKLAITKVKETKKANVYEVTANLTIKGITQPITFTATLIDNNGTVVANTNIIVDRSKYDVRYGSGSFFDNLGDKTIYDDFTLTVNLVTK